MSTFSRGFLFGVGLGLLLTPKRGQDMRRLVIERFQKLRGSLPETSQLNQYTEQISDRAAQAADALKDDAEQPTAQMKKTTGHPSRGKPLRTVPGMEPEPLSRLEAQGIATTQQLLERTATREEREHLAQTIGMTTHMLRSLVDRADLMRLPGVGADLATLLEEAGVNGCKDLQHRNPEHLYARLTEAQGSGRSTSHSPGLEQISQWIAEATLVAHA